MECIVKAQTSMINISNHSQYMYIISAIIIIVTVNFTIQNYDQNIFWQICKILAFDW